MIYIQITQFIYFKKQFHLKSTSICIKPGFQRIKIKITFVSSEYIPVYLNAGVFFDPEKRKKRVIFRQNLIKLE